MIHIEEMSKDDVETVAFLEKDIFSMPWSKQDFLSSLQKEDNLYLVAKFQNKIIGYCGLWGIAGEGQITNVAVKKEARGYGVGFRLVTALLTQGQKKGLEEFTLEVRKGNQAAIHLYQKLGFNIEGTRKDFYQNPTEDAVIMWIRRNYH